MARYEYIIGVDPGTHTGLAVYSTVTGTWDILRSMSIVDAMDTVYTLALHNPVLVIMEDASRSGGGPAQAMGAGSVRRDCKIWQEFGKKYGITMLAVRPQRGYTKLTQEEFGSITALSQRTNEHARDAGMLVWLYLHGELKI